MISSDNQKSRDAVVELGFPTFPKGCTSLLKQVLKPEIYKKYKHVMTGLGGMLADCIIGGVICPLHPIGIFAADAESYILFNEIFTPILRALHPRYEETKNKFADSQFMPLEPLSLNDPDPWGSYVISVRMSAVRNIAGVRFAPIMSLKDRQEVLYSISDVCGQRLAGLPGATRLLGDLMKNFNDEPHIKYQEVSLKHSYEANELGQRLRVKGLLPISIGSDPYRCASHLTDQWPLGRGVWSSDDIRLVLWINFEDHLRVTATEEVPPLMGNAVDTAIAAYARMSLALSAISRDIPFEFSPNFGYMTTSPSLLGTGLRVTVALKGITHSFKGVLDICEEHFMDIIANDGVLLISNKSTLGISEHDIVRQVFECVAECIKLEELYK